MKKGSEIMKKIIVISLILNSIFLVAQTGSFTPDFQMPNLRNAFSFLNMNKISMHHSMSFMSGFSSNKQGFYQSMYTNHLNYRISPKLDLKLNLNFVNNGSVTFTKGIEFDGNQDNQSKIIPEFQLSFRPTENTHIMFEFRQYGGYNSMNRDWSRW